MMPSIIIITIIITIVITIVITTIITTIIPTIIIIVSHSQIRDSREILELIEGCYICFICKIILNTSHSSRLFIRQFPVTICVPMCHADIFYIGICEVNHIIIFNYLFELFPILCCLIC